MWEFYIHLIIVLWTARRSNQSILKQINPEYSLEGLMLKLKLQHFAHFIQRDQLIYQLMIIISITSDNEPLDESEIRE